MESKSDDKKRLKTIVSTLLKCVECPLCLETVKIPFKVCVRGHSICLECIKKLEKCPVCEGLFTLENLVCLSSVLEALPHPCAYSDTGCEEVVEPGNDHEMFCGYRPIVCRHPRCAEKLPLINYLDHYHKIHPESFIFEETSSKIVQDDFLNIKTLQYTPVSLFNNLFWILEMYDEAKKQYNFFFQATPIGKLENDCYVRVKLSNNDDLIYTYTLKAQVLSSCEKKLLTKKDDQLDKKYCMKIPQGELFHFLDEEGGLKCSFTFFEKKL